MRLAIATLLVALVASLGPASAAVSPDPIVGVWRFGGGTVEVKGGNGRFVGVVRSPITFHECPHGRGEVMWTIVRTKTGYAGRHRSFGPRVGCGLRVWLSANWRPSGRTLKVWVARFTGQWARACGDSTVCFTLRRSGAAPPASAAEPLPTSIKLTVVGTPYAKAGAPGFYESSVLEGTASVLPPGGRLLLFHVHREGAGELIQLEVERASASRVWVAVVSTSNGHCRAGSRGTVTFAAKTRTATIRLCGRTLRFRHGDGARVVIRPR